MTGDSYYITEDGKKTILNGYKSYLAVNNRYIIKLVLSDHHEIIHCENNNIEKLYVPDNIRKLSCDDNVELTGNLENCKILINL
jgi:hypothetical protein